MIQQASQSPRSPESARSQQMTDLLIQNQRLSSQLSNCQQQYKKLQGKYQKSLKQLALIVKANQNIKKDYDELESKIDKIVEQKTQMSRLKIKQYVKKEIDELNRTIETLKDQKDQLQMEKNSLTNRVNTLTVEKTKILKEKEEINKKYNILQNQLQSIDSESLDIHAKTKSIKDLRQKARLVDELQEAVRQLQEQKQSIERDFSDKLKKIEELWNQWHQFQHQINHDISRDQIKLHQQETVQREKSQKPTEQEGERKSPKKKMRRRGSIIYEHGMKLLRGEQVQKMSPRKQVHFNEEQERLRKKIQQTEERLNELQKENQRLRNNQVKFMDNQKVINELKQVNEKLKEEKIVSERRVAQFRAQNLTRESPASKYNNIHLSQPLQGTNPLSPQQDDLLSVLRSLHSQMSPLRSELIDLKRQQSQQTHLSSTQKANYQVKLIRQQKQLSFYKQHNDLLKKQLQQLTSEKQLVQQLNTQVKSLETQKNTLQGKLIVMETLNVADRTRVNGYTYNTLKEFQKRMEILSQDPTLLKDLEGNHLQQLVAMKAYILELDQKLKHLQLENEKVTKKYAHSKQKLTNLDIELKQSEHRQTSKISMYKQKIQAYDKLVSKLTSQLQRNIARNNRHLELQNKRNIRNGNKSISKLTSEDDVSKVINLYEEKIINMGEELIRVRNQKDHFEEEVKDLRYKLNIKIRELNQKQRDIIMLKTQNIHVQDFQKTMEKEISQLRMQNQFYQQNHQSSPPTPLQKPHMMHLLEQQKNLISQKHQQQIQRAKSVYQQQIRTLKQQLSQMGQQLTSLGNSKHKSQRTEYHYQHKGINQLQIEEELRRIRDDYQKQQLASVQLVIAQHALLIQDIKQQHSFTIEQKSKIIKQLQLQLQYTREKLNQAQRKLITTQELQKSKDRQLRQLQQVILKNNYQITHLRNQTINNHYDRIESNSLTTENVQEYVQQNAQLQNDLYQKNVEISGLESGIYNLRLENQRIIAEYQILQDKLSSVEKDLKMKNSTIFHLENQVRNSSNVHDSTLMAKDSLIRSYQNQIKNLKHMIQDLKTINKLEKENQLRTIKELEFKLRPYSAPESSINANVNVSLTEQQQKNSQLNSFERSQENGVSRMQKYPQSSLQSAESIEQRRRFIIGLQSKIDTLQSQLKYTQEQLLSSSEELSRLHTRQSRSQQSGLQSSISHNQVDELKSQVLTLRGSIITLRDEIELKEQQINDLKQEIFNLKLKSMRESGINAQLGQSRDKPQPQPEQTKSPRRSPIHIITSEPLITELQSEIQQLRFINQQLLSNEYQQKQTITLLNCEIERLHQQIYQQRFPSSNNNHSIVEELNKLKQQQSPQVQKGRQQNGNVDKMELTILQLKGEYENQLSVLRNRVQFLQSEIVSKDLKITQLTRIMVQGRTNTQTQQTDTSPDIEYLLNEIQRLNKLTLQREIQASDTQTLLTQYQSAQSRSRQNLDLIFLLMVEIQSLRYQLNEGQNILRKGQSELIQSNRIEPISSEMKIRQDQQQKVDYGVIKVLQCTHDHLVNYQKMLMERKQQDQNLTFSPKTQTIVKFNDVIEVLNAHHRKSSLQEQHEGSPHKSINEMKMVQAISYPSDSSEQINNIDSNYSIQNPFKDYYRHAHSTHNPLTFSPEHKRHDSQTSWYPGDPIVQKKCQQSVQNQGQSDPMVLGSFGKIAQSQNVESSNESMSLDSNSNVSEQGQSYNLNNNLNNDNLSKELDSNGNNQVNLSKKAKEQNMYAHYSFAKPKQDPSQSIDNQVESRYIIENKSNSGDSQHSSEYGTVPHYSSFYLQQYPQIDVISSAITHNYDNLQQSGSYAASINNTQQANTIQERISLKESSNSYLPTYNVPSSPQNNNNQAISNLYNTNLNSTLDNKSSTLKQYFDKMI